MNESSSLAGTIEVVGQDRDGIVALVNGRCQIFPDLRAVFAAAVHLLEKDAGGGAHAVQPALLPLERSFP